ncbi:MAG TPA: thioredoxin domain-containing protein [Nitrospira sp.]
MTERRSHGAELVITDHDHVQGAIVAPITLVEYGDFECPYSREAVKTVQALQREFGDDLRFVFRHFPLAEKHPHAIQAAEAAEAAAAQDEFWAMYATLFVHQWELEYSHLMDYATELGLDRATFGQALKAHTYFERVRADVGTGRRHGVTGTPTFFVNGERQDGPDDVRALTTAIRRALSA